MTNSTLYKEIKVLSYCATKLIIIMSIYATNAITLNNVISKITYYVQNLDRMHNIPANYTKYIAFLFITKNYK